MAPGPAPTLKPRNSCLHRGFSRFASVRRAYKSQGSWDPAWAQRRVSWFPGFRRVSRIRLRVPYLHERRTPPRYQQGVGNRPSDSVLHASAMRPHPRRTRNCCAVRAHERRRWRFLRFLCVDEKRVGILVADVTGHGVPAALIASMLKVAFASQAAHAHDPVRVLTGLNGALCGKFEEHFVTAAYLFVDLYALHGRTLRSQERRAGGIRQGTLQRISGNAARYPCRPFC